MCIRDRRHLFERSSHMAPVEEPEAYASVLQAFLETVEQGLPVNDAVLPSARSRQSALELGDVTLDLSSAALEPRPGCGPSPRDAP